MMRKLIIASWLVLASSALADPVLVAPEQPSPWPITARLERPHSDETPVCDASAALARWAPEQPRIGLIGAGGIGGAEMRLAAFIVFQMVVTTYGLLSLLIGRGPR